MSKKIISLILSQTEEKVGSNRKVRLHFCNDFEKN